MLRSIIKISIAISLLTSLAPLAVSLAKQSIDSFEKSIEKKPELKDLKFTSEITLPEAIISPGDTVITVTRKGLLKDITYTIPIQISQK